MGQSLRRTRTDPVGHRRHNDSIALTKLVTRDCTRDMQRPLGVGATRILEITVAAIVFAVLHQQGFRDVYWRSSKEAIIVRDRVLLAGNGWGHPRTVGTIAPVFIIFRVDNKVRSWFLLQEK